MKDCQKHLFKEAKKNEKEKILNQETGVSVGLETKTERSANILDILKQKLEKSLQRS